MQRCSYGRHETLHELPAVFVNQIIALWWHEQGIEVELLTDRHERNQRISDDMKNAIEREHSWLSEPH